MKTVIKSVADLGLLARATRKSNRLRLADVAGSAKLGTVFVGDVEHGKDTVQFGLVLRLLDELGIGLIADAPQSVYHELEKLRATGIKSRKPRTKKQTAETDK